MVTRTAPAMSRDEVLDLLKDVKDPELPVIDVVELGIVRDVVIDGDAVRVDVTPTYSGCPALRMIETEIVEKLRAHGFSEVSVRNVFSPAWTTDWLSDETREKMRAYGIAPPTGGATESAAELVEALDGTNATDFRNGNANLHGVHVYDQQYSCRVCHEDHGGAQRSASGDHAGKLILP